MSEVTEYAEGLPVRIGERDGRPTVIALNQGGFDATEIDLVELIAWVRENRPELLE